VNKVTALLILLIGLLQYKLWFGDGNVLEFQRLNDRIAELRLEGAKRRERNAALEAEVMDLKQGLDAVEERARHELGMVMEGEQFVQVIDPQHEPEPSVSPPPEKPASTDEISEIAKGSNKEKSFQKKKPKQADKPKSTESQQPSAKKQPNQQTAHKKEPPKPKPVKPEPPPAKGQEPLFDEGNQ
jgi:cell division protein FtsB